MKDPHEILVKASQMLSAMSEGKKKEKNQLEEERKNLISGIGKDMVDMVKPLMEKLVSQTQQNKQDIIDAVSSIRIDVPAVSIPQIEIPEIRVPTPIVNYTPPAIRIPDIIMPDEMNVRGFVSLMGIDLNNPLPVQLRDAKGNPVNLFESLTSIIGGGSSGGGKHDFFTIKGFSQSAYAELQNSDGRLKVSVETGGSGITDSELRATSVPVSQVSGAMWSTAVVDIFGSTAASDVFNGDNRIRVSVETGGSGLTDAELRATPIQTLQVSGYSDSVNVIATVGLTDTQLRATAVPISAGTTLDVQQVSGANWSVAVLSTVGLTDTQLRASSLDVIQVSGASSSVNVLSTVGLTDTQLRASTIDTIQVSGSVASTQVKWIARTTNPAATADGSSVFGSADKLGRQLMRPVQVRDLTVTAYATYSTGTEATLLGATAGSLHDLIYVLASNNSTAAIGIDIRPVSAGNIVMHLEIPANGVVGVSTPVPIPQSASDTGNAWTVDLPDVTGTTVYVSALFSREI